MTKQGSARSGECRRGGIENLLVENFCENKLGNGRLTNQRRGLEPGTSHRRKEEDSLCGVKALHQSCPACAPEIPVVRALPFYLLVFVAAIQV
jgi:hypothetical protein